MSREDETRRQFQVVLGHGRHGPGGTVSLSAESGGGGQVERLPLAKACTTCRIQFSGDARFCPFDGEPLGPACPWDTQSDPLLGSVVAGRYEIDGVLGEGGMGRVYRARHGALGRSFALKVLKPELASEAGLADRFTREAKAAASVSSPHVVQITDFGELASGQPFFVMELLQGSSLSQVMHERGPLSPAEVVKIARPVAEGLEAAHAAGIIHRDLKPDNVHVAAFDAEAPIVKVLDFGLAKVAGSSKLTRDGMVFGTPHYMSPEQAAGEPLDHRVDVYSLGIVMYEMATGRTPFEADTYMGILTQHLHIMPIRPSEILGSDSLGALEGIILRCLAKRPAQRFDSMDHLAQALRQFERASGAPTPIPLRRIAIEPPRTREPWLQPQIASFRNRETLPAPPAAATQALRPDVGRPMGPVGADGGVSLRRPLSWVITAGSAVSVLALIYLLVAPRDGGPVFQAQSDESAVATTVPPPVDPLRPTASSARLASPMGAAPEAPPTAAAKPARSGDAPAESKGFGPTAAMKLPLDSGSLRLTPPPSKAPARTESTQRGRSRGVPDAHPPVSSPLEPSPPPSKLPTLSGGDIVDPWAQ